MKQCPRCRSDDIVLVPWKGMIYQCKNCGYMGPLVLEKRRTKIKV